jgi:hypothetical protein
MSNFENDKVSIRERFRLYYEVVYNNSQTKMAQLTGVAQGSISDILGARGTTPGTEVFIKLKRADKKLNLNWMLTGEGEMQTENGYNISEPMKQYGATSDIGQLAKVLLRSQQELVSVIRENLDIKISGSSGNKKK